MWGSTAASPTWLPTLALSSAWHYVLPVLSILCVAARMFSLSTPLAHQALPALCAGQAPDKGLCWAGGDERGNGLQHAPGGDQAGVPQQPHAAEDVQMASRAASPSQSNGRKASAPVSPHM